MDQADGKARALLDELVQRGWEPGPLIRAMANGPTLLRGYLDLTRAMKRTHLDRRIVERITGHRFAMSDLSTRLAPSVVDVTATGKGCGPAVRLSLAPPASRSMKRAHLARQRIIDTSVTSRGALVPTA
jgi:hypothetical protein